MDPPITFWKQYVSVQPPVIIFLFAQTMITTILQDFIIYQSCVEMLSENYTQCLVLHENSSSHEALVIKSKVQLQVSNIQITQSIITSIWPSILILFLGPWSDIYGRKPLLILGYLGSTINLIVLSILSSLDVKPWLTLLAAIPSAFFGGFSIIILSTICYICDITQERNRAWHLGLFRAFVMFGVLLGIVTGPIIYASCGYTATFSTAASCMLVATLYILFLVPESVQVQRTRRWSHIFDSSLVKNLIDTCVTKRVGFNRYIVWSCIAILAFNIAIMEGESAIEYQFSSARFGWNINMYSIYQATNLILTIIGTPLGIKIIKTCIGSSETVASAIFVTISTLSVFMKAFAWKSWQVYLAQCVGLFKGCIGPIIQTFLSTSIRLEDAGKIFSLTTIAETIIPVGAVPLFGLIYSHTMPPMYPSLVWFVSVAFYIVMFLILAGIHVQKTRYISVQCTLLDDENVEA